MNNKGFAVSTFMYMILILGIILILATLAILSSRKMILDKQKNVAMDNSLQARKKICRAVNGTKSLTPGTLYECKVNDEDTFNFYVLSNEGSKVNLIMDRNICNNGTINYQAPYYCRCAWHGGEAKNNRGPDTVMRNLYDATKGWTNIPDMVMDTERKIYVDEGDNYRYIKTTNRGIYILRKNVEFDSNSAPTIRYSSGYTLKARLPKESEILANGVNCTTTEGTCDPWIVANLKYYNVSNNKYDINSENIDDTAMYNIGGYWLASSTSGDTGKANIVMFTGKEYSINTNIDDFYGIRPVITVSKSNLYD